MFQTQQIGGPVAPGQQYGGQQIAGPAAYMPLQTDPFGGMMQMMLPIMMMVLMMALVMPMMKGLTKER